MDVNAQNLADLKTTYSALFNAAAKEASEGDDSLIKTLERLYREVKSTGAKNLYAWAETLTGFRKWVGERQFNKLKMKKYEVVNEPFEASFEITAQQIEDDEYGILNIPIQAAGASWAQTQGETILNAFLKNPKAYDGKSLFATDRKYGKYTINNKTTSALSEDSFKAALLAMAGWKFATGAKVKSRPTTLYVGAKLYATAFKIVGTKTLTNGEDNPYYKKVKIVELDELSGDEENHWYLINERGVIPPVVFQPRKNPKPNLTTDPIRVELENKAIFMADGRCAAAPTLPHLFYGGLVAAS